MFQLQPLSNDQTALAEAPMIRAAGKLLDYLVEHQTIGLTQTKAFQRKFVLWAAETFQCRAMISNATSRLARS